MVQKGLSLVFISFFIQVLSPPLTQAAPPLNLVKVIPLNGVEGRIDHFGVDVKGNRVFVSALGNNTVEVIDARANRRLHEITGLAEPQGNLYVPGFNKLFVANRKTGEVDIFDGASYKRIGGLDFSRDADNVRYDSVQKMVYIGCGEGALEAVDPRTDQLVSSIPLPIHPESFQLEESSSLIYVNQPGKGVAVVDMDQKKVLDYWNPGLFLRANYPMALDERDHRLFVVYRFPARLVVFDASTGKVVDQLACVGDSDDVYYDGGLRRIYASGGEGFISVFQQKDADHYQPIGKIPTASGARTSLFVPAFHRFYLAVPHRGKQKAGLWVYQTIPEAERKHAMDQNKLYECAECGLHYKDAEIARQCEAWCREHQSCNLEITRFSVERLKTQLHPPNGGPSN